MNERMHGPARRKIRGWSVDGVWEVASKNSTAISAVILGMIVYRCDEVEGE